MNILVLGGAGFLGSNLTRYCLTAGQNQVLVLDSLDERLQSTKNNLAQISDKIKFLQGDIRDAGLLRSIVRDQDVVFNCAAQTSHPLSLSDPVFDAEVNCLGNLNVLEAVRSENPEAVVVYPSTSSVIGAAQGVIDESHIEQPLDIYSAHKSVAEKHCYIYSKVHDLKTVVLRFANLYGPYGKGSPEFGFLNYFISLALGGQDITVYGTGGQTRNIMYVEDAADIMYRSATDHRLQGGRFFATHPQHLNVADTARKIVDVFKRGRVVTTEWPKARRRIEIDSVKFSSQRLRDLIGWEPKFSFEEGLVKTREILEGAIQS